MDVLLRELLWDQFEKIFFVGIMLSSFNSLITETCMDGLISVSLKRKYEKLILEKFLIFFIKLKPNLEESVF